MEIKTQIFSLWDDKIPYYTEGEVPKLTYYPTGAKSGRGAVIICPGGGYSRRAAHEGKDYAEYLNCMGLDAFVLDYRVAPNRYPAALSDIRRAIRFVRFNSEKFGIDKDKIAVMGSSAGGHLAAHAATYVGDLAGEAGDEIDAECYIPNGQILCYPVIDKEGHLGSYQNLLGEKIDELYDTVTPTRLASEKTPPAFIWHTAEDSCVDVRNTYRYVTRLRELLVPAELHIFPYGSHGLGLATQPNRTNSHIMVWAELMVRWLELYGFFK